MNTPRKLYRQTNHGITAVVDEETYHNIEAWIEGGCKGEYPKPVFTFAKDDRLKPGDFSLSPYVTGSYADLDALAHGFHWVSPQRDIRVPFSNGFEFGDGPSAETELTFRTDILQLIHTFGTINVTKAPTLLREDGPAKNMVA